MYSLHWCNLYFCMESRSWAAMLCTVATNVPITTLRMPKLMRNTYSTIKHSYHSLTRSKGRVISTQSAPPEMAINKVTKHRYNEPHHLLNSSTSGSFQGRSRICSAAPKEMRTANTYMMKAIKTKHQTSEIMESKIESKIVRMLGNCLMTRDTRIKAKKRDTRKTLPIIALPVLLALEMSTKERMTKIESNAFHLHSGPRTKHHCSTPMRNASSTMKNTEKESST
mmetsp:Transcript_80764/g.246803  ORF Transcript_80764/g.246803 Transcript_80764/m.246803 type:complete len:225 (-) Transcript_80764:743-1417(-)